MAKTTVTFSEPTRKLNYHTHFWTSFKLFWVWQYLFCCYRR